MPKCPHTFTWSLLRHSTDMHLKRFRRETVKEALRAVREELGPAALVLSTRVVAAHGMRGWFGARVVEVTDADARPAVSDDRPAHTYVPACLHMLLTSKH